MHHILGGARRRLALSLVVSALAQRVPLFSDPRLAGGAHEQFAMAKRSSALSLLLALGLFYGLLSRAFVSSVSGKRTANSALRAGGVSVPTGLVWPSAEAEEKLREVDGIKLYPTHAWKDDMDPILDSNSKMEELKIDTPVIVGVAADSGCGKSTFLRRILGALGTEVKPGHTAIGDMMTVICLDDYHTNDRAGRKATGLTALDARENDFDLMGVQMEALKTGKAVYKPIYNHDTGNKEGRSAEESPVFVGKPKVRTGLHPIYDEKARSQLDLAIYIDIVNDVKFAWKVQRDVAERGWTEEQVREDIEKRLPDFSKYVDPQKADADVILRYEPSDQGLPYLKARKLVVKFRQICQWQVKLIQKKERVRSEPVEKVVLVNGMSPTEVSSRPFSDTAMEIPWFGAPLEDGKFPMITLKKDITLTGSKPGAVIKMYDDEWFGSPVTVVEMDGEIDMDNMEEQLKDGLPSGRTRVREIESNMEGLPSKKDSELTEASESLVEDFVWDMWLQRHVVGEDG
eukprot:s2862_g6.t1